MLTEINEWKENKKRREEKRRKEKRRKGTQEQEQRLEFNGGCELNIECNKEGRQNHEKKNREQPKNRRRTSLQLHVVAATERGREKRESAREKLGRPSVTVSNCKFPAVPNHENVCLPSGLLHLVCVKCTSRLSGVGLG
jgi:hypothetical protein